METTGPVGCSYTELNNNTYIIPYDVLNKSHVELCEPYSKSSSTPPQPIKKKIYSKQKVYLPDDDTWSKINRSLTHSDKEPKIFRNVDELSDAISYYNRGVKTFTLLKKFVDNLVIEERNNFYNIQLRAIIKLALRLPEYFEDIPLLTMSSYDNTLSLTMSQEQIACLLANAFLCTIQDKNTNVRNHQSYPYFNFSRLFQNKSDEDDPMEKLKSILVYLDKVSRHPPLGVVTFMRRSVAKTHMPNWKYSTTPVGDIPLRVNDVGHIHEADGLIQADFANKYIGGGVIGNGAVQEEIRFATCPELIASMLFTEKMYDNEAVMITGAKRYCKFIGYSRSFNFGGEYNDNELLRFERDIDDYGRHKITIVAIDALNFKKKSTEREKKSIDRELNKAWVGFSFFDANPSGLQYPGVATGNWGCGAFNGSTQFKTLIQLLACAQARRPMAYYTMGDTKLKNNFYNLYRQLQTNNVDVGQLYRWMTEYEFDNNYHKYDRNDDLYQYIQEQLNKRHGSYRS